jgi:F-type H+-transporting ATPase subunit gamma
MSKLIQMRGRIQTIETIRKVTDAMRIISMSAHSRLKTKQEPLGVYLNALSILLAKVQQATPSWSNERLMPTTEHDNNPLIILIGSQKGLCGGFNTLLAKFFAHYLDEHKSPHYHYVGIGKKAIDYLQEAHPDKTISAFPLLTAHNFLTISQQLSDLIMTVTPAYTSVTIFSNTFKSFFVQKQTITHLIPFDQKKIIALVEPPTEGYLWDEQPHAILDKLAIHYIEAQLQNLLFQSLLSEHAARFISMDNSTRNANTLLETTKLEYNKLRQAKITTEITELSGSF